MNLATVLDIIFKTRELKAKTDEGIHCTKCLTSDLLWNSALCWRCLLYYDWNASLFRFTQPSHFLKRSFLILLSIFAWRCVIFFFISKVLQGWTERTVCVSDDVWGAREVVFEDFEVEISRFSLVLSLLLRRFSAFPAWGWASSTPLLSYASPFYKPLLNLLFVIL